ncbi:MAG: SDR family NAD(P)-dependent oxidoreductase, partial [Candidatus Ranarchaeia archaeon]
QVAIVTGSSRGIGRAVALGLAKRGAKVVINYVSNKAAAEEVADRVRKLGGDVLVIQADMAEPDQIKRMVESTAEKWGRIDILVNNAGFSKPTPLEEVTNELYEKTIKINQHGVVSACRAVIPFMLRQKYGRIINISSIGAQIGCRSCFPYCISKAAVIGITRSLAWELAESGITVNTVSPGSIKTDMLMAAPKERLEAFKQGIPMGRFGEPEELAYGVIFLASKGASYITGQVLSINGGQYMSG